MGNIDDKIDDEKYAIKSLNILYSQIVNAIEEGDTCKARMELISLDIALSRYKPKFLSNPEGPNYASQYYDGLSRAIKMLDSYSQSRSIITQKNALERFEFFFEEVLKMIGTL